MSKIGRNQPCPCGSGKKFKKCHGHPSVKTSLPSQAEVSALFRAKGAREKLRQQTEGYGRPVISTDWDGQRVVAIGNKIAVGKWRFFTDFLIDFAKDALGREWGKSLIDRGQHHPFINWLSLLQSHKGRGALKEDLRFL